MSKWLARLREHEKNKEKRLGRTDKIDRNPPSPEEAMRIDERAAVLEYDLGLSRDDAERLAHLQANATLH